MARFYLLMLYILAIPLACPLSLRPFCTVYNFALRMICFQFRWRQTHKAYFTCSNHPLTLGHGTSTLFWYLFKLFFVISLCLLCISIGRPIRLQISWPFMHPPIAPLQPLSQQPFHESLRDYYS